jgi:hypothetical protein
MIGKSLNLLAKNENEEDNDKVVEYCYPVGWI